MIESRCGLRCAGCPFKESHGCGGCIETNGNPFHGECPIAVCCQEKGLAHCGECEIMPCGKLYGYSYLDPEHGDKPQGARVMLCREWGAKSAGRIWKNVLLTSAGFADADDRLKPNIVKAFYEMLDKPREDTKVLFIQTAAIDDEAKKMARICHDELLMVGILSENITSHEIDGSMTKDEAMGFDTIYFTGGNTAHLLSRMKETGFDDIVKSMVSANKVYIGVSAGSLIATPNIGGPYDEETAGLCLINAYISVHCAPGQVPRDDMPLEHIPLCDNQAIVVGFDGYKVISDW